MQPHSSLSQAFPFPIPNFTFSIWSCPPPQQRLFQLAQTSGQGTNWRLGMSTTNEPAANVTPCFVSFLERSIPEALGMVCKWGHPFCITHRKDQNKKKLKHGNVLIESSLLSSSSLGGIVWALSREKINIVNLLQARAPQKNATQLISA